MSFVSNSSSTSFTVTNLTDKPKTIFDFAKELHFMVDAFNASYHHDFEKDSFLNAAINYKEYQWAPHQSLYVTFGDEDGNYMGVVFDYMLRAGGKTESFKWNVEEYNR